MIRQLPQAPQEDGQRQLTSSPDEERLLAAYRKTEDSARANLLRGAEALAAHFPRQQPTLVLVAGASRPARGFANPLVLVCIAVIALLLWFMVHDVPPAAQAPDAQPAALAGASIAYVPYVFADQATGCQYLSTHTSTGLVPRIAADGKTHAGCKGSAQ